MAQHVAFTATDPNHTFTYTAGSFEFTREREIVGEIFLPDAPGDYPVVFYSHGFRGSPLYGGGVNAAALADAGYIVIAPRHLDSLEEPPAIYNDFGAADPATSLHRVADMQFLLDILPQLMAGVPGYTADATRAAIAGHSLGAFTSALLAGTTSSLPGLDALEPGNQMGLDAIADARFTEAMLLSAQGAQGADVFLGLTEDSWDNLVIPTLFLLGTEDTSVETTDYRQRLDGFDLGPAGDKFAVVIANATHAHIGGGDTTDPAITAEVAMAMVTFLRAYVENNPAALAALRNTGGYADAHALAVEVYEKFVSGQPGTGSVRGGTGDDSLQGLSTNDTMLGRDGNDVLAGHGGNDRLNGGTGVDQMRGGTGNDAYYVDNAGDATAELAGEGSDTVYSSISWTLAAEIERLYLTGTATNGTGNTLVNYIYGNGAANTLNGLGNADRLTGYGGGDIYIVDSTGDLIFEDAGAGTDTVISSVNHTLAANVENLSISAVAGQVNGTGNSLANTIWGGSNNNYIDGKGSNDTLTGGLGIDNFLFTTALGAANVDTITDFTVADDTLRLDDAVFSALPAGFLSAAAFISGTGAITAAHRIIYNPATGDVFYDADGAGGGAQIRFAVLGTGLALTSADVFVF